MAEKKAFKAESKRLLDLMINSIYTHKEIFLRELISNASDAIDKRYYEALAANAPVSREDLKILIELDKTERTIKICDNGIGMSEAELEENLGTIAQSGSLAFKEELAKSEQTDDDVDIIGQFGVGFYSAFMVAKEVEVISRKAGSEEAFVWKSDASDGYTIEPAVKESCGTTITVYLKENTDDENYDTYLDEYEISRLVKKYSDYIRYPIVMEMTKSRKKEDSDEYEDYKELETLNSMVPLWKRNKNEITEEEYQNFYKDKFNDYNDAQKIIHTHVEGNVSFDALLFIPSKPPMNFYSQDYEKGLQLYSRGVFIMDKASELIPEYFRFVKGLVDSQDLSLNISREMLQHDRQLKFIAKRIEKKIKSELEDMLKNDRENYEKFYQNFGLQLKYGIYQDFGMHKELLQDLLLYYSSSEKKMVTLKEYVSRMKEGQEFIYFMSGSSYDLIDKLPQCELVKDKGYEILYMIDNVDEFALQAMGNYDGKTFKNISQGDLNLDSEEEKKALEDKNNENKELLDYLKEALGEKVSEVKLSSRLKSHPVCLSSGEGMSFEMEKVLDSMPEGNPYGMKATRVLEINPSHPIFDALNQLYAKDKEAVKQYADLLYRQALLIEGFTIDDPMAFSDAICDLMVKANQQ